MPEKVVMVSSCPLCLGPDEVTSMVSVEIDRVYQKGRVATLICRSCCGAVIKATDKLDEPLADPLHPFSEAMTEAPWSSKSASDQVAYPCPPGCALQQQGVEHTHHQKESDDDPATD